MKLGFIGFGNQAKENILPACSGIFGTEFAAICDSDECKLREAQELFPNVRTFTDHQEMMDSVELDAVIAACYPSDHYNIAVDALSRGIAVFIEKPLAPSAKHVDHLVELARETGCATGVGMNFRFAEVTRRLDRISGGDINSLCLRQHANKPATPFWDYTSILRSFLHAQTIHGLDWMIHMCGPVRDLRVSHSNYANKIMFTVMMDFQSGAHGSLITSNTSPHFVFDFDAICRRKVHVNSSALWDLSVSEVGKTYLDGETKKWTDHWAPSPLVSGFERSGYRGQFEDFITAIKQGRDSSTSFETLTETYRCMEEIERLCFEKYESVQKLVS